MSASLQPPFSRAAEGLKRRIARRQQRVRLPPGQLATPLPVYQLTTSLGKQRRDEKTSASPSRAALPAWSSPLRGNPTKEQVPTAVNGLAIKQRVQLRDATEPVSILLCYRAVAHSTSLTREEPREE